MAIKNSTFADMSKAEVKVLTAAYELQFNADTASDAASTGWQKVVTILADRGIKTEYLKSPNGQMGAIDGDHVNVFNFVRDGMLLPINAADPQAILDFIHDDDFNGKAERAFTVMFKGKMTEVNRTKKAWQSQFTLLAKKIDAAIAHCKKLNPEKDESIADLDIVSILLGLETAKDHLIQK
jgi:hypothetical protein